MLFILTVFCCLLSQFLRSYTDKILECDRLWLIQKLPIAPSSNSDLIAMQTPIHLIPSALAELFAEVNHNGYITLADRYGLMAAIFDENLTEEDKRSIDRLLRSVCRGKIKLVNELSMLR